MEVFLARCGGCNVSSAKSDFSALKRASELKRWAPSGLLVGDTTQPTSRTPAMTHRKDDTTIGTVMEYLIENGMDGMAEVMALLMNEAMKIERSRFLGADLYERSGKRRGQANSSKPKTVVTRIGPLGLQVPQTHDVEGGEVFYPSSLERGLRSERALKLPIAEMYNQGVSTRRLEVITLELCGLDVARTEVSRAATELDELLESWRIRDLGVA